MSVELFLVQAGRVDRLSPTLRSIAESSGLTVAFGTGALNGEPLGAALAADWFAVAPDAVLELDSAGAWSGAVVRVGRALLRLYLLEATRFDAASARRHELCDGVAADGETALQWLERWIAGRNLIALESAAALVRLRGGDRLERAEFGRLFAAGEPQAGLRAFLDRKSH